MKYTLFIDESGDFTSQKGEWVIGGTLFEGDYQTVADKLNNINLKSTDLSQRREEFHLTELRSKYGNDLAIKKAEIFFDCISRTNLRFIFVTVVNEQKTELSQRERTYRAMLRDLLSMLDNSIPLRESIDFMDLVIASRTIDGIKQTYISDIFKDIFDQIPKDLEYDLSTLSMVNLIRKRKVIPIIKQANSDWGLICSDFISNITYNRLKKSESELIEKLQSQDRLFSFNGLGDIQIRRARIAERNNDLVLSVERWLTTYFSNRSNPDISENCKYEITRLVKKIFSNKNSSSHGKYSFLSLFERIWRLSAHNYEERSIYLKTLDKIFSDEKNGMHLEPFVFKLRNLILLNFNHEGNIAEAKIVETKQMESLNQLIHNPTNLSLIEEFLRLRLEIYLNDLDFVSAKKLLISYEKFTENISEIWDVIGDSLLDKKLVINKTDFWLKRECCCLRAYNIIEDKINGSQSFEERLANIKEIISNSRDLSRYNNIKIIHTLNKGIDNSSEFLSQFVEKSDIFSLSDYDLLLFLKIINSELFLNKKKDYGDIYKLIIRRLDSDENIKQKKHPNEMIYAEAALFSWFMSDIKKAKSFVSYSLGLYNLSESNISKLLYNQITLYEQIIFNKNTERTIQFFIDNDIVTINDKEQSLNKIRNYCIRF
ncbi:hypothetical protein [Succinivibrio sp.]|uniref:hypothetical protein n=1 Tax=Succinivibrio sp. TaxID=2053619 RepID=UPI0025881437|nr:hypothetical protein [Succinivibrio sp.]MDD6205895.1 hypothetical protein [Succinivibrio sp.]